MAYAAIKNGTFIDQLDDVVEAVVTWAVEYIEEVAEALAPDGRTFGMEKLNERQEVRLYNRDLRGNPEAWEKWIRDGVSKVKGILAKSGISEEKTLSVHPYDVVERYAILYSYRMEKLSAEYAEKASRSYEMSLGVAPSPSLLPPVMEMAEEQNGLHAPE